MATKKKNNTVETVQENEPNIQFVGRETLSNKEMRELEAPPFVTVSTRRIDLPPGDEQKAGFYLPRRDAVILRRMFPQLWKEPVKLGNGKTSTPPSSSPAPKSGDESVAGKESAA